MQIIKYLISIIFTTSLIHPFTIMIDPSGDAKHTGRVIEDTFERGITLQFVETLKKELNKVSPKIRVVLTRVPGETIQPLQNASFANRLQVDFYLSIYFYEEPELPSHIYLYQYVAQKTDFWHRYLPLSFYQVNESHQININESKKIGEEFLKVLSDKKINRSFETVGLFGIPFQPLLGIKAPALAIEAGIRDKEGLSELIAPLVNCIKGIKIE